MSHNGTMTNVSREMSRRTTQEVRDMHKHTGYDVKAYTVRSLFDLFEGSFHDELLDVIVQRLTDYPDNTLTYICMGELDVTDAKVKVVAEKIWPHLHLKNLIVPLELIEEVAYPYVNGYIRAHSGVYLNVESPDPGRILVADIIRGFSRQHRYAGQSNSCWTVGMHTIWMVRQLKNIKDKRQAFFHDGFESYANDIPRPIKVYCPEYELLEDRWMRIMSERFEFDYPFSDEVMALDKNAAILNEWNRYVVSDRDLTVECLKPLNEFEQRKILAEMYCELFPEKTSESYVGSEFDTFFTDVDYTPEEIARRSGQLEMIASLITYMGVNQYVIDLFNATDTNMLDIENAKISLAVKMVLLGNYHLLTAE